MRIRPLQPPRVLVVHSPHSGRSERLQEALTCLDQTTQIVSVIPISALDHLPPQGPTWLADGIDVVVAGGGDGLVGGVITHLAESGPSLGILPLGTANDVARSLGIPQELRAAVATITTGKEVTIDIGCALPAEQAPHAASKTKDSPVPPHTTLMRRGYFAHALTVGLNVQFARIATNITTRERYGRLTYPVAALEVFTKHTPYEIQLTFDGLVPAAGKTLPADTDATTMETTLYCRALQATVINAPIFGGQWQIALPHAVLNDRLLDIVVVEDVDLKELGAALTRFFNFQAPQAHATQRHYSATLGVAQLSTLPGVHHFQARGVSITTSIDPQDATLDGEVRGQTPIHARIADKCLHVLVPDQDAG